jgi:hypothetical protein
LETVFLLNNKKNSIPTSQETHYVSATNINWLILFRETIALYCESRKKHKITLCGKDAEFWYVQTGGSYGNHWALKGQYYIFPHISHLMFGSVPMPLGMQSKKQKSH